MAKYVYSAANFFRGIGHGNSSDANTSQKIFLNVRSQARSSAHGLARSGRGGAPSAIASDACGVAVDGCCSARRTYAYLRCPTQQVTDEAKGLPPRDCLWCAVPCDALKAWYAVLSIELRLKLGRGEQLGPAGCRVATSGSGLRVRYFLLPPSSFLLPPCSFLPPPSCLLPLGLFHLSIHRQAQGEPVQGVHTRRSRIFWFHVFNAAVNCCR